jgi:hypothetical protein
LLGAAFLFVGIESERSWATSFGYALAFLMLGGVLGFLFGVPKVYQRPFNADGHAADYPTQPRRAASSPDGPVLAVNTNLKQRWRFSGRPRRQVLRDDRADLAH